MRRPVIAALALAALGPAAAAQDVPTTPPAPLPLAPAAFPPFREATLPNGLRIIVVENRRQPVISVTLAFGAGSIREPAAKAGLADMTAGLLDKGAGNRDAEAFAAAIEGVGGSFAAFAGSDFLQLRANTLSRDAALAFELLADAARRPAFPEREVELLRTQRLSAILLQKSQPQSIANRTFLRAIYGQHPYGRSADEASVKGITRDDIVAFHRAWVRPAGALLVVAGDISLAQVQELAARAFGNWSGVPARTITPGTLPARTRPELVLVHRPGSVQSNVLVGNTTWLPTDPRGYAATVANEVLGGGSEGRLFVDLRERKGWTYGAYSELATRRGVGYFRASGEFRTEVTDSAVRAMLDHIRDLRAGPVPAAEFEARKGSLTGRFPLQVETAEQVAGQVATARLLGQPANYVQTYRQRLAAVTAIEAHTAARAAMRLDDAVIVVVGDGTKLFPKLKEIAATRLVDVDGKPLEPADLAPAAGLALDWTALQPKADSFAVLLQGNPIGFQASRLERTTTGWSLSETTVLGPILSQQTVVTFGPDGAMQATKQQGKVQGQEAFVDVTYANGRATGKAKTPGPQGLKEVAVDAEVPAGSVDDNLVQSLLPHLPLKAGAKVPVPVFQSGKGVATTWTLGVDGEESVTVPAGTFAAWRVSLQGGDQPVVFFVAKDGTRQLVKVAFQGAPIEIVRVK